MEHRWIGGIEVSVVGVGCSNFGARLDQEQTTDVVVAALDAGITLFDTADLYGGTTSEVLLGRALKSRRDEAVIATKFGLPHGDEPGGGAPDYVRRSCEGSLRRLGTETIDLFQLHAPDSAVPLAETLGAMAALVDEGKVRALGCSNFTADELRSAHSLGLPGFSSVQNQYSLLWREPEQEVLGALDELDMALLPYYPLANGLLTGKYARDQALPEGARISLMPAERTAHWLSDVLLDVVEQLRTIAGEVEIPMATLAFSWLASHPRVASVIAGASNPAQVEANASAVTTLSSEVVARLEAATASLVDPT